MEAHVLSESIYIAENAARDLHNCPENSYEEIESTAYIRRFCTERGLELIATGMDTGLCAVLNLQKEHTIAFRADIDAVPTIGGPQHICGHDYHTASLLGAIDYFCRIREKLDQNLVFIFQPAEECTSGARAMLDHGLMDKLPVKPECLFGIHNRPEIDCGKIAVHEGPLMAEKSNFRLLITGKTGHGGEPQKCVDPMVAAAQFILGAQTIVSRNVDPNEACVCSVLSMKCGDEDNFVPDQALLTGSIRSFSHEVHMRARNRLEQIAGGIMQAFECEYQLEWDLNLPAINNGHELWEIAREASKLTVGEENTIDTEPALGSDDFSVFGTVIPAFYYWVGSGESGKDSPAWHKPDFHVDDGYLKIAVPLLVNTVSCQKF